MFGAEWPSANRFGSDATWFPPALLARYSAASVCLRSAPISDPANTSVPTPTLMVNLAEGCW